MIRVTLLPLGAAALAVACSVAPAPKAAPAPAPPGADKPVESPADVRRPTANSGTTISRLWRENCQSCHGENGEGGGAGTPSLISAEKFSSKWDRPFFEAILKGVPDRAMPAYAESLTDPEIWGLVVHLRERQKEALRAKGDTLYPESATPHKTRTEDVFSEGLRTPWSLSFLPGGAMLVTNRGGELLRIENGRATPVTGVPDNTEIGQGGLMEVAVHPTNGYVYLSLTDPAPGDRRRGQTKIVRGKLVGNALTGVTDVWKAPADSYTGQGIHFGSKIVFDGKGHVFFTVGERGTRLQAQELDKSTGKIYRVMEDGALPKDNPFAGKGPVAGAVWSMGHRNQQGLTLDAKGDLWDTEHGPRGGDELNRILPGRNYGWPTQVWSIDYNDQPFTTPWPEPGKPIEQPVERWLPSIGASGLTLYKGKAFPKWSGDLLAGGLAGQNLDRFRIRGDKVVEHEELLLGKGRVRDVRVGPDGFVYVVLNGPDKIIRLVP